MRPLPLGEARYRKVEPRRHAQQALGTRVQMSSQKQVPVAES